MKAAKKRLKINKKICVVIVLVAFCLRPNDFLSAKPAGAGTFRITEEEAVRLAITASRDLEKKRIELAAAEAMQRALLRNYFPQGSVSISSDNNVVVGKPDSRMKRAALSLVQPIYTGGKNELTKKANALSLMISRRQLSLAQEQVGDAARFLFAAILGEREKLRIQKESLFLVEKERKALDLERAFGGVTELDVIASQVKEKKLAAAAAATELAVKEMFFALKQLLFLPASEELILEGAFDARYAGITITATPLELYIVAKQKSLTVAAMELDIRKAAEELTLARRSYVPSISLETSVFIQGESFPLKEAGFALKIHIGFPEPGLPAEWKAGGGLRTGGQTTRGGVLTIPALPDTTGPISLKAAAYGLRTKRLEADRAMDALEFSIYKTLELYEAGKRDCSLLRDIIGLEKRKLLIIERKEALGEATRLSVLDARLSVSEQELFLLDKIMALKKLERELENLLGLPVKGLWKYAAEGVKS